MIGQLYMLAAITGAQNAESELGIFRTKNSENNNFRKNLRKNNFRKQIRKKNNNYNLRKNGNVLI